MEGTHVPGVNYPEALSTNLTSKRTSHKLAEQGRRNRINVALQELQALIPSPSIVPKDAVANGAPSGCPSPEESQQKKEDRQSSSKANTVETAIEYIRLLKRKDEERDRKMMEQQQEIEDLRKRLESGSMVTTKETTLAGKEEASSVDVSKEEAPKSADGESMDVGVDGEKEKEKPAVQEAVK